MALGITITPDPYSYVVRLKVAGGTPPYTVTAQPGGGRPSYVVRPPQTTVIGDASARNLTDGQAPFGNPIVYSVTDAAGGTYAASAVELDSATPVLSDTLDPTRFLPCTVEAQKPNTWDGRTVWFDVLGRRDPTVAIGPLRFRHGELLVQIGTGQRAAMLNLLSNGDPLLLRTPCADVVDDVTMAIQTVEESLIIPERASGPGRWTLTYQAVTVDLGPYAGNPSRTYADVVTAWTIYADLPVAYATYAALLTGDAFSGMGPQLIPHGWDTPTNYSTGWSYGWSSGAPGSSVGGVGQIVSSGTAGSRWIAIYVPDVFNFVTTPGKKYRLTFQARLASGASGGQAFVEAITNTAPGSADYFAAGAVSQGQTASIQTLDGTWRTITFDATIPAGDDRLSVSFNVRNMPSGAATYEVRSPSVRELL